jgi:arylsulfatase A-like enzyme
MMKPIFPLLLCLALNASAAPGDRPPNIVFILADDLGWADTSLYGQTKFYRTPNIARLAKRGMTFTDAYSASPLCSPTRAAILTGLSPARIGITAPNCHLPEKILKARTTETAPPGSKATQPISATRLATSHTTLAENLKAAGYATGHFGKWHLGTEPHSPLQHGFDTDIPHFPGPGPAGGFIAPWKYENFDPDPGVPNQHIEDRMAAEAVAWMEKNKGRPFFLNYWMFSVHAPFDAKAGLIQQYKRTVDPADAQHCPTYAAMIESMDAAVGTLLSALDRLGIADNTIIVFTSDNGGNMYDWVGNDRPTSNRPLRGGKATIFEGGVRVPCVIAWPGLTKPGSRSDAIIQSEDFHPTFLAGLGIGAGQHFDGIDISPALRGGALEREAVFQYFPHSPPVPDWLPPAVAVRSGDMKLIRLFHQGENGAHAHRLYDMSQDPGEATDLSTQQPERVRELDAKIEAFLRETGAALPLRNPNFDPLKDDPGKIGIQQGENARPTAKPK